MNPQLKKLMKQLGEAINESLADSEQIGEVVAKLRANGYDVFLVLEATIGLNRRDEAAGTEEAVAVKGGDPEFKVSPQDVKFLRSLRISLDEAA